jgi:hypothetical protein
MFSTDYPRRRKLANCIRAVRDSVAMQVTADILVRRPDWAARYGARAEQFGIEDAKYHIDFLASGIEAGGEETYRQYGRWAATVLTSRGIEANILAESLCQIQAALLSLVEPVDHAIIERFVTAALEGCTQSGSEPAAEPCEAGELVSLYVDSFLQGKRRGALALILDAVRQGHAVLDLYAGVLEPAMCRIGAMWETNRITVAQEHTATLITQFVMANLYPMIDPPSTKGAKLVLTGVPGEYHQLGANMVADSL